jgi:6-phosphogluconolactonase (cycloisomerase 2 family)
VPDSPFPAGTDPKALALYGVSGFGTYLYAANAGSDTVSAFAVDTSTGSLASLSPATFATGKGPSSILQLGGGPSILYVANNGGPDDISAFLIDPNGTGVLHPVSGSPFPAGGNPLSLAAAGSFLCSANPDATSPSISGFSIDFSTGVLSPLSGSPFPCNRAATRFDVAEVPTLDHRGLDRRSPSLSKSTCWKAGGARRISRLAHLDMKVSAAVLTYALTDGGHLCTLVSPGVPRILALNISA